MHQLPSYSLNGIVIIMYCIRPVPGDNNLYRLYLHENCHSDIHHVCLDVLPLFDEGRGAEYTIESNSVATIATL